MQNIFLNENFHVKYSLMKLSGTTLRALLYVAALVINDVAFSVLSKLFDQQR
jgi:hypothetical protein